MRALPLSVLCLMLAGGVAAQTATPREGAQSGSVVSRVTGETVRFVAEEQLRPLVLGQDLLGGDMVRTGAAGVVGILFVDGTVMRLHPQTELIVNSVGSAAELELTQGTIWARAPRGQSDITIATPAAAAGIRGTDWVLSVEGGGLTRLTVYDGAVELANPQGTVLTQAGEAAVASPGSRPVKVGVANRREAEQMLYTVAPSDAVDLMLRATADLGESSRDDPAFAAALSALRRGDPGAAAALERAARGLGREQAAAARWLAAIARLDAGAPLRPPPASNAESDAIGAAVAAAMLGDLDRTQAILASVSPTPTVLEAATQVAILRDDTALARATLQRLEALAPGSVAAREGRAAYASAVEGDHAEALRQLRAAVRAAPDRANLWNSLGLEEDALDHPLEAEAAFRRALALQPDDPAATGNLAILLMDQERMAEARVLAERLLARDPASYLGLRVIGRIAVQENDPEAGKILLRALAAQPAAAETSLSLAIAAQMSGDEVRAEQELDAAGRLDPNDPIVPLVRSITALDDNRVDDAIAAGRAAAALLTKQEGSNRVVAADRQTGAPLAGAYATIGLDGWARYAADRTYDPLSAGSLFNEGTQARLTLGRDGPSSDGYDSALVSGLLLEPLSASYRLRYTDILRRPFTDFGLTLDAGRNDVVGGFEVQGYTRNPTPLAYSLTLSGSDSTGLPSLDRVRGGQLFAGTQIGARAGAFALLSRTRNRDRTETTPLPGFTILNDNRTTTDTAALGGHLRLTERSFLTIFAGHTRQQTDNLLRDFVVTPGTVFQLDSRARSETRSDRLSIGYHAEDSYGYWTAGLEGARLRERVDSLVTLTDLLTGAVTVTPTLIEARSNATRAYLGRRQRISDRMTAEGLLTLDDVGGDSRAGGRLGLAWQAAPGHWLRVAGWADGNPAQSSLAPASVLGLVPLRLPYRADGRMGAVMARYDVELGERLLIGVEHQNLSLRNLSYATDDPTVSLDPDRARLSATSLRADWWIGEGVGLTAAIIHADSAMRDGPFAGQRLPLVPEWTAELGLGWLRPSGFGGSVRAVWTGRQFAATAPGSLPPVLTVDAGLSYETRDKRFYARVDVTNLFDQPVASPWSAATSGREMRVSLAARF